MSHAESPVSANFRLVRGNGTEIQFTMREGVTNDQVRALFKVVDEFVGHALEKGWSVAGAKPQPAAPQPQAAPQAEAAQDEQTFEVNEFVVTSEGGKTYIKVKGGRYSKFGAVVWPEVLGRAGIDVTSLPKGDGWTAHYVERDGKPKVTRLTYLKPAEF